MPGIQKNPTTPTPLAQHPARLPIADIPEDADHASITASAVQALANLSIDDLADDAIWRDTYALTGTLRTFYSSKPVSKVWQELAAKHKPSDFAAIPGSSRITRLGSHGCWLESRFTFSTDGPQPAKCSGIIGLVPSTSQPGWKTWLLSTILEQPNGFPDVEKLHLRSSNAQDTISDNVLAPGAKYDCVVVGASIAGLCMAARLQALELSYLLIEKQDTVGDNWLKDRYTSLKLHTSKHYNQMPYEPRTFREEDPYHLGTADLAAGFRRFVDAFGINLVLSSELTEGSFNEADGTWSLQLKSHEQDVEVRASHCVLAVGNQGVRSNMPSYPGQDLFQGEIIHGMDWRNADRWQGKSVKGVCIGSANTAHGVNMLLSLCSQRQSAS
jgi:hypothetical protein